MADDDAHRMPCWPHDNDWLDGRTEIFLTSRHLRAYWDADIIDDDKNKHDNIIERNESFVVRFRVELKGRLWYCLCGHWCFNLGFTAIGKGEDFNLSDVLPDPKQLYIRDWKGCDTRCIEKYITVPAGVIPADAAARSTSARPGSSCAAAATARTTAAISRSLGTSRSRSTSSSRPNPAP